MLHIFFKFVLFGSVLFLLLLAQLAVGHDPAHVHEVPLKWDFLLEAVDMPRAGQVEASVDVKHEIEVSSGQLFPLGFDGIAEPLTLKSIWPILGPEILIHDEEASWLVQLELIFDRVKRREVKVFALPAHLLDRVSAL